jgi:predicted MFS family arabinose efflux permease
MIVAHGLFVVGALLLLAGMALNPALTTFSLLIDQHVCAGAAEAFGWLSTALSAGTGAASAIAAAVAQHEHSARAVFVVAAVAGAAATAVGVLVRPRLARSGLTPTARLGRGGPQRGLRG